MTDETMMCTRPPVGWTCHRDVNHDGPCAASPAEAPARGIDFLTDDERRFFAYMAEQRFRTVSEKDPEKREAARARWQQVALWFDPSWTGSGDRR